MKKIRLWANMLKHWWTLHFCNTKVEKVKIDAYEITFRKYTMQIRTKSGNLKLKTTNMLHPNAFLYHSLKQDDENALRWFCNELYQFVTLVTTDAGLIQDVNKAFNKYYKRLEKKSESLAKAVSEEDDNIALEQVKFNQEYAKMSKKERKVYKEAMREVLNEEDNDE